MHLEGYAFRNFDQGMVDLYTRSTGQLPLTKFGHYQLFVGGPSHFWKAAHYRFVGEVTKPEWVPPLSRL